MLSNDAFNGLNKIARKTKMDCWCFFMREPTRDFIYDIENSTKLSLEEGLPQFADGIIEPLSEYGLTADEQTAVKALFEHLHIELRCAP